MSTRPSFGVSKHVMPTKQAVEAQKESMDVVEPLPNTGISKMLGLCEILDDRGGREDGYRLAQDLGMPFAEVLLAIKGAEMLGLIDTPGGDAVLTPLGKRCLEVPMNEKKALLKEQMKRLRVFRHIIHQLERADENELDADVILEEISLLLPLEQPRAMFSTLINWGRYGEILGYSRDTDKVYLNLPEPTAP